MRPDIQPGGRGLQQGVNRLPSNGHRASEDNNTDQDRSGGVGIRSSGCPRSDNYGQRSERVLEEVQKGALTVDVLSSVVPKQENTKGIRYERDAGGDQHHRSARRLRMKESSHSRTRDENGDGNQSG